MNGWPLGLTETFLGAVNPANYACVSVAPSTVLYGSKDLNLLRSYACDKPASVSEHIQNWRDRCIEVGQSMDGSFEVSTDFQIAKVDQDNWTVFTFSFGCKLVGWVALKLLVSGDYYMELYNSSTALTPDSVLVLGQSSKRSNVSLAGYFGEGVKVEINRLLDCGANISYFTNNSLWSFGYLREILHAAIQPYPSLSNGTLIQIMNLPQGVFNPQNFLFFQPSIQKLTSKVNIWDTENLSGIEIILEQQFRGKVFIHGIFVMNMNDAEIQFGLNYIGKCIMSKLSIGRDRDSMRLWTMSHLIADVFAENMLSPDILQSLSALFYNNLKNLKGERHSFSHTAFLQNSIRPDNVSYMANILLEYFFVENGSRLCLPCEHIDPSIVREAEIFGYSVVQVDSNCMEWLRQAKECPTIAKLWEDNKNSVLALPEYVFDDVVPTYPVSATLSFSSPLVEFARSIRHIVGEYFGHVDFGNLLRFKDFSSLPTPNTRRFIPIKYNTAAAGADLCVLDVTLLNPVLIHEDYQRRDPSFVCEGNCGCITNSIIDDMLNCMSDRERHELDSKFRRKYLNSLPTNIPAPPSRPPTPSASITTNNKTPDQLTKTSASDDRLSSRHTASSQNGSLRPSLSEEEIIHREVWYTMDVERDCLARECCKHLEKPSLPSSSGRFTPDFMLKVEDGEAASVVEVANEVETTKWSEVCPISDLTNLVLQRHIHLDFDVFLEESNIEYLQSILTTELPRSVSALNEIILFLTNKIFHYSPAQCHLFMSDSKLIAFNRSGHLYFNILVMVAFYERGPKHALHFWFSIFAHEIAHNKCLQHNEYFATIFGFVLSFHMEQYVKETMVMKEEISWEEFIELRLGRRI